MLATPNLPWTVRNAVPAQPAALPRHTSLVSRIALGLPHLVALDQRLSLGLVAPTGLARFWLATPRDAVVSAAGEDVAGAPPFRLLLRSDGGALIGVAPLVIGPVRFVGAAATLAPGLRLRISGWRIHAGSLVGGGDFGSFVSLDWLAWGRGADRFEAPVARPAVLRRLAADLSGANPQSANDLSAPVEATAAPGPGSGQFSGYGRRFADD